MFRSIKTVTKCQTMKQIRPRTSILTCNRYLSAKNTGNLPAAQANSSKIGGVGAMGGLAGSLVGLGGGFVTIPALVGIGFTQHAAHATSLASVFCTSLAASVTFGLSDAVDVKSAVILAVPAVLTVSLGAKFSTKLDGNKLKLLLGLFMMGVAPLVPARNIILESSNNKMEDVNQNTKDGAMAMIGGVTGFASGLFGVGGGSIMTPAIALCSDLNQHTVIGTSLAAMIIPSLIGTIQHHRLGNLNIKAAIPLSLGTAFGAFAGSKIALAIPEEPLRILFGVLMFTLGARQSRSAWKTIQRLKK